MYSIIKQTGQKMSTFQGYRLFIADLKTLYSGPSNRLLSHEKKNFAGKNIFCFKLSIIIHNVYILLAMCLSSTKWTLSLSHGNC